MRKWVYAAALLMIMTVGGQFAAEHYRYALYDWAIEFETSRADLDRKVVDLDGDAIAYLEGPRRSGQQTMVMLHGFGASKENWLRFAGYLSDRYHVLALDLSGHGENPRYLERSYSVDAQVAFVRRVLEALKVEQAHFVGNSMGGAISSLYAATHPQKVLSVTLISPAGIHEVPSLMDKRLAEGDNPLIATSVSEFFELLDFVMEDKPYIPGPIARVEGEKAVSRVAINRKIFSDLRADMEKGLEQRLKEISVPVFIIWGAQDRAIHVGNIEKYAALIPDAETLVMEEVGHLAMIEQPEASAHAVLEFLASRRS